MRGNARVDSSDAGTATYTDSLDLPTTATAYTAPTGPRGHTTTNSSTGTTRIRMYGVRNGVAVGSKRPHF